MLDPQSGFAYEVAGALTPNVVITSAEPFGVDNSLATALRVSNACGTNASAAATLTILPCDPDLDGDGAVNAVDLGILLGTWGNCGGPWCPSDLNADGAVDAADLGVLLGAWS